MSLSVEEPGTAPRAATEELHYLILRLSRAFYRVAEDVSLRNGISVPDLNVLLVLGEGVPMSPADLGRRSFVTAQASHQVVASLRERGLIELGSHPTNRRVKLVSLTPSGWDVLKVARAELHAAQARATEKLSGKAERELTQNLLVVAETLRGGWFGDEEAERAAAARRSEKSSQRTRRLTNELVSAAAGGSQ
jgi:DNA-binding MarR family transcriptional regulator